MGASPPSIRSIKTSYKKMISVSLPIMRLKLTFGSHTNYNIFVNSQYLEFSINSVLVFYKIKDKNAESQAPLVLGCARVSVANSGTTQSINRKW